MLDISELNSTADELGYLVRQKNSKNSFFLKSLDYYEELASLVEILKVEGWWNKKGRISISNKSPELLCEFEELFNAIQIKIHKNVRIKVKIPPGLSSEDNIRVMKGEKEKKFYFGRNGFTKQLDRIVFCDDFSSAKYTVTFGVQKVFFETIVSKELLSVSHENVQIYGEMQATNKSFTTFLEFVLREKSKSHEIKISEHLKSSDKRTISKVFARVVDCEGSIRFSGFTRDIHIRMINKEYLESWQKLLQGIGIVSRVSDDEKGLTRLTITCNQNFKKLESLDFKLCHKTKKERFQKIIESYKKHQLRRNTALETYFNYIMENPKIGAMELAKKINKSKKVVSHYLLRLQRAGKIKVEAIGQKYLYSAVAAH